MKKMIKLWAISSLVLGMFAISMANAQTLKCVEATSRCNALGYTKTEDQCSDKDFLRCPFENLYYCNSIASCEEQGYTASSSVGCEIFDQCITDATKYKCDTCSNGYTKTGNSCTCVNANNYPYSDSRDAADYCSTYASIYGCYSNATTPRTMYQCTSCGGMFETIQNGRCVESQEACENWCKSECQHQESQPGSTIRCTDAYISNCMQSNGC